MAIEKSVSDYFYLYVRRMYNVFDCRISDVKWANTYDVGTDHISAVLNAIAGVCSVDRDI